MSVREVKKESRFLLSFFLSVNDLSPTVELLIPLLSCYGCMLTRKSMYDRQDIEKRERNEEEENDALHSPGRPFQSARVLLQSCWIPPFLFLYCCLVRNRMSPHVPADTKTQGEKEEQNRTDKRKTERTKYFEYYSFSDK